MNEDIYMKILDEDIITKVLKTSSIEYESLVDSLQVQMDTDKCLTLDNLKEQLRSKYQLMKKNESKSRRHETILNTRIEFKQKRVYKTTRKRNRIKKSLTSIIVKRNIIVKIFVGKSTRPVLKGEIIEKKVERESKRK